MSAVLPLLSFVVPVYFEQDVLPEFHRRLGAVMDGLADRVASEVVYVDDGSLDASPEILAGLAAADGRVRVVYFSRNFGHQLAITAGLDHARGDAVVTIDSDLQDPPEVVPKFVEAWQAGAKVVVGVRRSRAGESAFKRATAKAFYWVINRLSDVPLDNDAGDFRLLDRQVIDALRRVREIDRYLRGIISWLGFAQARVAYDRDPRAAGTTKYPLRKMVRLAFDGISSFSDKPLRAASHLGLATVAFSIFAMTWVVVGTVLYPKSVNQGWASVMIVVLFLGGVQLLSIGVLGEYVGRIFRQTKDRPLYVVARTIETPPLTAAR